MREPAGPAVHNRRLAVPRLGCTRHEPPPVRHRRHARRRRPCRAPGRRAGASREQLVMQVSDNDPAKWNLALNNAKNVQTDLGARTSTIEIVAYGPGIGMLKADSVVGNRVAEAMAAGVKVVACENTMTQPEAREGRHADEDRLREGRRRRDHAEAAAGLGLPAALKRDRRGPDDSSVAAPSQRLSARPVASASNSGRQHAASRTRARRRRAGRRASSRLPQ